MRITLGLVILGLCAWGSVAIITARHGFYVSPPIPWLANVLQVVGPWVSVAGGFILWRQSRLWRRLEARRHQPMPLTRDPGQMPAPVSRAGALERASFLIMVTGAVALVYQLGLARPAHIFAAAALVWWFGRVALKTLRKH